MSARPAQRGDVAPRHASIGLLSFLALILLWSLAEGAGRPGLSSGAVRGPGVTNHPVGVRPSSSVRIPENWPLGRDGTLTCLTCHETLAIEPNGDPRLREFDLGESDSGDFCARCHVSTDRASSGGMHWMAVGRAHVRETERSSSGLVDVESRRCMGCHDGVTATEFTNQTPGNRSPLSMGDAGRNHPIGIRYAPGRQNRPDAGLRPASVLPQQVRLPAGTVGCVSCHDLYARDEYHLTVPIEGSQLCLTCHNL